MSYGGVVMAERWLVVQGSPGATRSDDGWYALDGDSPTEPEALDVIRDLQGIPDMAGLYATLRQSDNSGEWVDDRWVSTIVPAADAEKKGS